MRFIIDGLEFSTGDIGDLEYRDILAMPKQAGMGVQTWGRVVAQIERLALAPDGESVVVLSPEEAKADPSRVEPDLLFDSERHLRAFLIMMWLARRTNGQPTLTFEDSTAVRFSAVEFIRDDDDPEPDDEPEPDPQTPSASAPDAGGEASTSREPSPDSTSPSGTSTDTSST